MASLVVINGRHQGEWYTVGHTAMIFGRDDGLLAEIIDPRVSRRHLEVRQGPPGTFQAVDLGSHNGTRINGRRLPPGDQGAHTLAEGDTLQIGHTLLVFTFTPLEDDPQVSRFVEQARARHDAALQRLGEREKYTDAAALFSRLFRRPGRGTTDQHR